MQSFGRVNSGPHDMDVMLVLVPTEGGHDLSGAAIRPWALHRRVPERWVSQGLSPSRRA
jgi:hypothetical protein